MCREGVKEIETMENFFKPDGLQKIMFYYQETDNIPEAVEHVRLGPGGAPRTTIKTKPKVFVTDGKDNQLSGACVFFIRINPSKQINTSNI
ncbi:dynein axonemal heavy chain 5-like [Nematostella vectensis]|uniref:dynein axonemal heavy chain 5-like n=1 Tax=Nematostella vectensis TaxID=45351 RepID=UPI00139004E2|nr:dynein axonemal heavy chain 5-like [Nematostella vectensis]